jgi:hypothetical protein
MSTYLGPWVRLVFDPPVRMMDQPAPLPAGMARGERLRPDLIDVVPARRLASDDLSGSLDRRRVADAFPSMADWEPGGSA